MNQLFRLLILNRFSGVVGSAPLLSACDIIDACSHYYISWFGVIIKILKILPVYLATKFYSFTFVLSFVIKTYREKIVITIELYSSTTVSADNTTSSEWC